jgi:hypothetical protein
VACSIGLPGQAQAEADGGSDNSSVQCAVRFTRTTYLPADSGEIAVVLKPIKGIHVIVEQPVSFTVEFDSVLRLAGDIGQVQEKKTGYLAGGAELKQKFRLASSLAPGIYRLNASVIYYYCSDSEGWCKRHRQPVVLNLTIAQPAKHQQRTSPEP